MSLVLIDTGALVALLNRREQFHAWAVEKIKSIRSPMLACEPVRAEVCFLPADVSDGREAIQGCLDSSVWQLDFAIAPERKRVFAIHGDACLVRMAELHSGASVFALDGQFRVHRKNRRQLIPLIIPDEI